ncbi:MAG: BamA/TamA family outer membrane protein [Candidatus Gastranaerophilales bacterium]|nr:BamA/TamA family outer membrane protein [Candidatus Gastranaerophilales bacterium]
MNSVDILRKSLILLFAFFTLAVPVSADTLINGQQSDFEVPVSDEEKNIDSTYFDTSIRTVPIVKDIEVLGTNVIKPAVVISKMQLHKGDPFDADMVQRDLKNIYQLGFFTEKMKAIPIENSDGTITLKILLEENIPVTDVTIDGNTVISSEELMPLVTPLIGRPQNIEEVNAVIEKINECYAAKGYILARVDTIYDDPDGTINIGLKEGTINKILISGNQKTKEYVITRNVLTEPGMVYNENQIKEDLVRLYSTQAFKDVNRSIDVCSDDPDKYDVTIMITEQRTASISVGGGLDSSTGVFGSLGISDNNFRGLNQRVSLSGLVGTGVIMSDTTVKNHMNFQAELSFFQPYFLNADTSLLSKIFFRDFGSYNVPLAVEDRLGIEASISHRVKSNPHLATTFAVGVENIDVREGDRHRIVNMYNAKGINISERAKQLEGGLFLTFSPGLNYDTRDSALNPRNGVLATARFDQAFALDEFNKTHGKLTGMIKRFFPVARKSSLSFTAKAGGRIYGDKMPEVTAFRLGGPYTIRGYKINGVGTGKGFAMGTVELATPVLFLDRLKVNFFQNLRLTFFVDAGKVFGTYVSDRLYDRPMEAITAGIGLKLYIPGVGPLSVDYGIPLTRCGSYGNKNGYFTFGVGDMMY